MAQERAASDIKLAIGVAKKCCPICRMLKDIAQDDYQVQLDLPGQHGAFHRWVPPRWLPIAVLDEIEKRLLPIVSRLVDTPIPGSRASSPASDLDEDRNELPSHIGKPRSLSILQHWNIV
ncbi:hypothetical protein C8J57DRAFT_254600 [Mycena rebaudengoi]|nr:hypothetical protein C8J57DRAFT_254600 [Mycena rebaudengoi]